MRRAPHISWFMIDENPIRTRYQAVRPSLDERGRRLHAAAEAVTAGHGGIAATSRATKVARSTIGRGLKDLREPGSLTGKVRRQGANWHQRRAGRGPRCDDAREAHSGGRASWTATNAGRGAATLPIPAGSGPECRCRPPPRRPMSPAAPMTIPAPTTSARGRGATKWSASSSSSSWRTAAGRS